MNHILHATFATAEDGIRSAEVLLYHGVRAEAINLILPKSHPTPTRAKKSTSVPKLKTLTVAEGEALALPHLPLLPRHDALQNYGTENVSAPVAPGDRYNALGAEIPVPVPSEVPVSLNAGHPEAFIDTEEGTGLGLGLGLLTAMCIPGIGLIAGSGVIVAGLMAAVAVAGGIAGGIYGYLIDRGVAHEIAQVISNHLEAGGTTLSVSVSEAHEEAEIVNIVKDFGGHLIP